MPELSERRYLRALVKHILVPLLRIPQQSRGRNRLRAWRFLHRSDSALSASDAPASGRPVLPAAASSPARGPTGVLPPPAVATGAHLAAPVAGGAKFPDRHRRRSSSVVLVRDPSARRSFEQEAAAAGGRGAEEPGSAPDLRVRPRIRDGDAGMPAAPGSPRGREDSALSAASNATGATDTSFITAPSMHFEAALLAAHGVLPPRAGARIRSVGGMQGEEHT